MENSGENLTKIYSDLHDLKNDFRNFNLLNRVSALVKGKQVLEIGCGNGILLKKMKDNGKSVTGIEPNEKLINIAKNINPDLAIIHGTSENLEKLVFEKFDTIIMTDVLEHIEKDGLLLDNLHKYLNKTGELVLVVPAYQALYGIRDKNIGHYRRYSKRTLKTLLKNNNFTVTKLFYWNMLGVLPYFLYEKVWKKPLSTEMRSGKNMNVAKKMLSKILFYWFKYIENNTNLGFGLSLFCVAKSNINNE